MPYTTRKNPKEPKDLDKGVQKYVDFHDLEPKKVTQLRINIPEIAFKIGDMEHICYFSKKWDDPADYIHHHQSGVNLALVNETANCRPIKVPQWFYKTKTIVKLGDCIGLKYKNLDGESVEPVPPKRRPKLYCTANGRGLLIVTGNRIDGLIWGGFMSVEPEGIVG